MTPVTRETPRAQSEQPNSRVYIDLTKKRASSVAPRNKKRVSRVTTRAPLIKTEASDALMMPPPSTPTGSRALVLYKGPPKQRNTTPSPSRRRSTTPRMPFPWRKRATPSPTTARGHHVRGSSATVNNNGRASQARSPTPGPSRHSRQPSTTSTRCTSPGAAFGGRGRAGDSPDTAIEVDEDSDSDEEENEDEAEVDTGHNKRNDKQSRNNEHASSSTPVDPSDVTLVLEGRFVLRYECRPGSGHIGDRFVMPLQERISLPGDANLDTVKDQVDVLADGKLESHLKAKSRKLLLRAVMDAK